MDIKNIVYISLVVAVIVFSASVVSAGWFDSTVEVDGIKFNIPSGYDEGDSSDNSIQRYIENEADDYENYTVETKVFEKDTDDPEHPGLAHYPHYIVISVISDSDDLSLEDVNNYTDYHDKTVNNKNGLENKSDSSKLGFEEFYYVDNGKLIKIYLYDPDGIEFENIIVD